MIIITVVHPIITENSMSAIRCASLDDKTLLEHAHFPMAMQGPTFLVEGTFTFFKRALIGLIRDPNLAGITIMVTGLEEAVMRSTLQVRDTTWLDTLDFDLSKKKSFSSSRLKMQRKRILHMRNRFWSAAVCFNMFIELVAILAVRSSYLFFRSNRFSFDLGYTFAGAISPELLVASALLELMFEAFIDYAALSQEAHYGIDLRLAWSQFREHPQIFLASW